MGGGGGQEEGTVCMCSEEMVAGEGQSPKLELELLSPFLTVSTASLLFCMSFHQLFKSCFWVETWKDNIIPKDHFSNKCVTQSRRTLGVPLSEGSLMDPQAVLGH